MSKLEVRKMKYVHLFILLVAILGSCRHGEGERQSLPEAPLQADTVWDSTALRVAVMPTLDCLPMYVAEECGLFDSLGVDVRLVRYTAHMDCDTALQRERVDGMITDLVRAKRLEEQGVPLDVVTATNAYWQLLTNRNARIVSLKHLDDKMLAMTRFSATALLADRAVRMGGLTPERVFRIQINDVGIRLRMIENNSMDAMLLTEPQATEARLGKHRVLMDTRKQDICLGAVAFRAEVLEDKMRKKQVDIFLKAYNMACDTINKNGITTYKALIASYCNVGESVVDSIPKDLRFAHAAPPRKKDIELAESWLNRQ